MQIATLKYVLSDTTDSQLGGGQIHERPICNSPAIPIHISWIIVTKMGLKFNPHISTWRSGDSGDTITHSSAHYNQLYNARTEWPHCKVFDLDHPHIRLTWLPTGSEFPMCQGRDHPLKNHTTKDVFQSTFRKWGWIGARDMCKCSEANTFTLVFGLMSAIITLQAGIK
jgi:hypothetical protein